MKLFLCVLVAALIASAACRYIDFSDLPPITGRQLHCFEQKAKESAQDILDSGCSLKLKDIYNIAIMVSCYK